MKDFGKRIRNKGVILAIALGLVPLMLKAFGVEIPVDYNEIVYMVSGILVMLGILQDPKQDTFFLDEDDNGIPDHIDEQIKRSKEKDGL